MNCYSLPNNERDYYRLAQIHRTYINRVPYSHRGTVGDGLAPVGMKSERLIGAFGKNDMEIISTAAPLPTFPRRYSN